MTITHGPEVPEALRKQIDSGRFAKRINAHVTEGEALERDKRLAVYYYVQLCKLSYAKTGDRLGISGERVRQIAEELGIKSRLARGIHAAAPRRAVAKS